jgi:DNA transposition AAA+ family ATPase
VRKYEQSSMRKINHPFVMTTFAEQIFALARTAHLEGSMVVLTGRAGSGKTMALRSYTSQNPSVLFITADVTTTKDALLRVIHRLLGMTGAGTLSKIMEDIGDKLRVSERLVIVDESDLLSVHALEALRAIHDSAGVGVLLSGMPRLIEVLRGRRGQFEQLYSRCETHLRLEEYLSNDDSEAIITAYIPEAIEFAKTFVQASRGNTRMMATIVRRCMRIAEKQEISVTQDMVVAVADKMIV